MTDPHPARKTPPLRIGLVGCVKGKATAARPARDLYTSALFHGRRRYVEQTCARWYILSARHGLVQPGQILQPYDESLTSQSRAKRRAWSERVLDQLDELAIDHKATIFEIHAGAAYWDYGVLDGLDQRGACIEIPAQGLGLGRQLAFYATAPHAGTAAAERDDHRRQ